MTGPWSVSPGAITNSETGEILITCATYSDRLAELLNAKANLHMPVRPLVRRFAQEMERQLLKNDDKTGKFEDAREIVARIYEEMVEVTQSMEAVYDQASVPECADVANFCAMLASWGRSEWPWVNDTDAVEEVIPESTPEERQRVHLEQEMG